MLTWLVRLGVVLFAFLDAVIIRDLWRWFASPVFGIRPISVLEAFGLNLLGTAFMMRPEDDSLTSDGARPLGSLTAKMLLVWGLGFIASRWM